MTALTDIARGIRRLKDFDDHRRSVPGEHWATFGAGVAAVNAARRLRSPGWRGLLWIAGALLVVRALSGRDGPIAQARRLRAR